MIGDCQQKGWLVSRILRVKVAIARKMKEIKILSNIQFWYSTIEGLKSHDTELDKVKYFTSDLPLLGIS